MVNLSDFQIKTDSFEGPLDLLLALVEKRKLHISQVSLSQVADDFINYLQTIDDFPTAELAQFLLIASTLMLIKSSALLPQLVVSEEEKSSMADLESRLRHYEQIRQIAQELKGRYGRQVMYAQDWKARTSQVYFLPPAGLNLETLKTFFQSVLSALPQPEKLPEVIVNKVKSLEEAIAELAEKITSSLRLRFSEAVGAKEKGEIIVNFLGLLELIRRGVVSVEQKEHFSDIDLETKQTEVPRYV